MYSTAIYPFLLHQSKGVSQIMLTATGYHCIPTDHNHTQSHYRDPYRSTTPTLFVATPTDHNNGHAS